MMQLFFAKHAFRSPTGLIKIFMRSLIPPEAKICDTSQALWGAACFAWDMLGDMASLRDNLRLVSPCLINGECRRLTCQDTLCGGSTQELTSKYVLAKTELLVYSRA
jgi:hypothetical protein